MYTHTLTHAYIYRYICFSISSEFKIFKLDKLSLAVRRGKSCSVTIFRNHHGDRSLHIYTMRADTMSVSENVQSVSRKLVQKQTHLKE